MKDNDFKILESLAGFNSVAGIGAKTRSYLTSPSGLQLSKKILEHILAYNSTDDIVPYFGDYRLAHAEAYFQLKNSVCLAYQGFYSQAFATLRIVCELSLLQASLPEGSTRSNGEYILVAPIGFGASQNPEKEAQTLEQWAVEGCKTPKWRKMLQLLLKPEIVNRFNCETRLDARLEETLEDIHPYIHTRGYLKSATRLSSANFLRFSRDSFSLFVNRMASATQLSVTMLLLAFLPSATFHPGAASGFIDISDLIAALRILPERDAKLLRDIYDERRSEWKSA